MNGTYALRQKKPGFLSNLRDAAKYFRQKTRFLATRG
jgi:hypothetical protein